MILRIVLRSLATRPMRTAVLAAGFGLAVAVMAELLGVGEVILEQAHSPALRGGGDVVVAGEFGSVDNARFVLANVIRSEPLHGRVAAASPSRRAALYLIKPDKTVPVSVRGGIPSLEKAVGDPEVAGIDDWTDASGDAAWSSPSQTDILRAMDRFHPVPPAPPFIGQRPEESGFSRASWAEWLYFNGRSRDGQFRFYLTFLTGPPDAGGKRQALVRLQLDRGGRSTSYSAIDTVDEKTVLERAPDIDIGANRVRLEGLQYRLTLALARESRGAPAGGKESAVRGEITLDARPGRSLPPTAIQGAQGWLSGYVAPVLSGVVRGSLSVDGERVSFDDLAGYHDHNWGFWEGVRWQWGQVAHNDLSIVFGRVFPPSTVADPDRVPGFLGLLGPAGPIAFSTDVEIEEQGDFRAPRTFDIRASGEQLKVRLVLSVEESIRTRMALTQVSRATALDFLQLGGVYQVTGRAGSRDIDFKARGSAETFRPSLSR
jgi:hypothetical protein